MTIDYELGALPPSGTLCALSIAAPQAPEYRRLSSEMSGSSTPLGASRRWQRSINKITSINRIHSLRWGPV